MAVRDKSKIKILIAVGFLLILVLLTLLALSGGNLQLLKSLIANDLTNEELSDQLRDFGWRGYIVVAALSLLQVVCTFFPAEPVQVLAGFTFGFPVGLLCCMIGILIGNTLIYMLQNVYGDRLRGFFMRKLNLDLEKIASSSKAVLIIFILYFLPAIPYGMICFFAASMGIPYRRYIVVTTLGSLPSVCIGVGLGYMTIASHWLVSVCVFTALILVAVIMFCKREILFEKLNRFAGQHKNVSRTKVQKVNGFVMNTLYFAIRCYLFLCGVRVKTVNKIGAPEAPSIVLCNHGSFIDFIYAAALLRKYKPHFIVARLYFYHTILGFLLRAVGSFPKSMFATDLENAKNCLAVLRENRILGCPLQGALRTFRTVPMPLSKKRGSMSTPLRSAATILPTPNGARVSAAAPW